MEVVNRLCAMFAIVHDEAPSLVEAFLFRNLRRGYSHVAQRGFVSFLSVTQPKNRTDSDAAGMSNNSVVKRTVAATTS